MNKPALRSKSWFIDQLNLYQAANSDHQAIKNNFIIRLAEFSSIVDALLNKGKNDPLQHELILGLRGSGKSTLLKRTEIEIIENENLSKAFIPINLAEEQAGIFRLFDLWEQVIHELNNHYEGNLEIPEFSGSDETNAYCRQLYHLIHSFCQKEDKRIVLLLDNFDRIVENFHDDGNLLREILINHNDIAFIGASTRMDEHFWRYDMPFYDFFRYHRLSALSREEVKILLNHWSEAFELPQIKVFLENNPGKIENVRLLTDGMPRTLQFFMQMVMNDDQLQGYDYLKKIIDHVTPLYQERLRHLTPQLRKIVLEMAFIWESCSTGELAVVCRMSSKLVSANLNTLCEKGIVDKIEMSKKNHLYRISERFFNLWLIITQGNPEQKRRARWLSIFIESWYDVPVLKEMAQKHLTNLKSGVLQLKDAIIMTKALSQSRYITTTVRDDIIKYTEELLERTHEKPIIDLPDYVSQVVKEIMYCINTKQYSKALQLAESIENEADGLKFEIMGYIFNKKLCFSEAEKYYQMAIEKGRREAKNNLPSLYKEQSKVEEAENYYLTANHKDDREALNIRVNLSYVANQKRKTALQLAKQDSELFNTAFLLILEIWNGIFEDVESRIHAILRQSLDGNEDFIADLLIHQQKNLVIKLFNHPDFGEELKNRYSVLYYATLLLDKRTGEDLILRIPPEISQTVNEMVDSIKERQKFYGY